MILKTVIDKGILLVLITVFFACSGAGNNEKINYQSNIFIEQYLIDYYNQNPGLNSADSVKRTEALNQFKKSIKVLSNDVDFLKDFPLQVTNIRDTVMGDRSFLIATFNTYIDKQRDEASLLNRMSIRINGIFEYKEQAAGLVLGGKYYLKALLYKQGKRADINYSKTSKGAFYNLGVYPMAIKKLLPIITKDQFASL